MFRSGYKLVVWIIYSASIGRED